MTATNEAADQRESLTSRCRIDASRSSKREGDRRRFWLCDDNLHPDQALVCTLLTPTSYISLCAFLIRSFAPFDDYKPPHRLTTIPPNDFTILWNLLKCS
uniref:Uncharacterized protein n=1 Tax=Ascaris lumbricoides TaxID=6252 RepID=A0A0M3HTM6_ASCLU